MKNILFATLNMNIGGVEKSLVSLLQTLDPKEYSVDLLLLERSGGFLSEIPSWVNVMALDGYDKIKDDLNKPPLLMIKKHFRSKRFLYAASLFAAYAKYKLTGDLTAYYKAVFKKYPKLNKHYDAAVSFTSIVGYLTYFVMYHITAAKKVGWIHFDVTKYGRLDRASLKMHENMDKIYAVSKEALDSFISIFPTLEKKCELKYNTVDTHYIKQLANTSVETIKTKNYKTIVTLGRLSPEKGQDIIPLVAQRLANDACRFKWYLIGDGTLRKKLEEEIQALNLKDYIILLGTKQNPYPYLKQADIYVQTSVHEGYCITLAEARVFGMPIVSTDFAGAKEQLEDREDCKVVTRSVDTICEAITDIINSK